MAEVQDVFLSSFDEYRKTHFVPLQEQKAAKAIMECRTDALGGHSDVCTECGYTHRLVISNNRILSVADGKTTFLWKDYRDEATPISVSWLGNLPPASFTRPLAWPHLPLASGPASWQYRTHSGLSPPSYCPC